MEKKKLKWWQKLIVVLLIIVAFFAFAIVGLRLFYGISVREYYKNSEKTFYIPDTNKGFVSQGLEYDGENGLFLTTGYMNNGSACPLYLVDKTTNKLIKSLKLSNDKGEDYKGHSGGVTLANGKVYVAEDKGVLVYDYSEILSAENNSKVKAIGYISTNKSDSDYVVIAFVTVFNDRLVVGEFYRPKLFETLKTHHITTKASDKNTAIAVCYNLNSSTLGVEENPCLAYSITREIQGMCYNDGKIYLSRSWALDRSRIYVYDESKLVLENPSYNVLGVNIPLYSLDKASMVNCKKIAPMSEEMAIVDGKMYVMCESASNKYIFGKFLSAQRCYATDMEFFN